MEIGNWVPTLDTLYKLRDKNEWIASYLADEESNMGNSINDKLVVFFVRESNSHQIERIEKSMEVLKMVGLDGWQNNYPRELSLIHI